MGSERERASKATGSISWGAALLAAAVMVLLSFLTFVLIPNCSPRLPHDADDTHGA